MSNSKPVILFDPYPRTPEMVYTPDVETELAEIATVVSHFGSRADDTLVEKVLPDVEIIVGQTAMPKSRLERATKLRAILNVKANWEPNIDYQDAQQRGVFVLSAAPAMAPAVAEFCIGQAIALARGLPKGDTLFRRAEERYGIGGNQSAYSLYDANVGLIGYGNLGRALVPLLRPFHCNVSVYDPWLSSSYLQSQDVTPAGIDDVLSSSRFLFILAGVTAQNEGFLDRAMLSRIQTDACVILASRAEVVEFPAFIELAASGRWRAAVDVYPQEPVPVDAAFRSADNVLFSAHLAGGLHASYARIREMMMDDIRQLLRGLPPLRMQRAEPAQAASMRSR